jgi:threonine dehydrogenase-like Zn-dependent dehydrogenase
MKALLFQYSIRRLAIGRISGLFGLRGYLTRFGHLRYATLPDPKIIADDWLVIRPRYCGICGSDHKQVFLDGNVDNPMTAVISFPQVLGHEVVGWVEEAGPAVTRVKTGDRVALNPWVSCMPRGFKQPCSACAQGKNTLCRNFTKGHISAGIHTGNSSDATGGFAERVPAHESMAVPIPEDISFEQAVVADPFSVALHSVLKVRPKPGSVCAVYGLGTLGSLTVHILKKLFRDVRVIAIARYQHQAERAGAFGADLVLESSPPSHVIEGVADYVGCEIYRPGPKRPWLIEGVDYVFDTVASPETLETGIRITKARERDIDTGEALSGKIVVTGVSSPRRFEWTPWYFKDITIIGSNAFSVEDFEGIKAHAYGHYFRLLQEGRVDPSTIVTHRFPLSRYRDALVTARGKKKPRAIKVVFDYGDKGARA